MISIDWDEYILFNRIVVVVIGLVIIGAWILDLNDLYQCTQLSISGNECQSCGVTRDFISFLRFDFSHQLNENSLRLFIYFFVQAMGRFFLSFASFSQIGRSGFIYKFDLLLTFIGGCIVILPFWI